MWKNLGDVVYQLQLFVAESSKGSGRIRSDECGGEGMGSDNILVGGRSLWQWALVVGKWTVLEIILERVWGVYTR